MGDISTWSLFRPVSFRSQVVQGLNHFVKVRDMDGRVNLWWFWLKVG